MTSPLSSDELRRIDAWWRAANYLSVGQIYLLDNPLLREPLTLEHVKPRLLGHWGTTPGLNLIYAHLNRAIVGARPERDLRHRPGPRRARARRQRPSSRAPTPRSTPTSRATRRACAALPPVLVPRRHPEPRRARDPGLDPRGRRARLRARPRLRRRVRQPGPGRLLRRRRRRGRDRPARGELALEQVPQPGARRRGAADPAPQRLQDRQPDGAGPHPRGRAARAAARATATRRCFVDGRRPGRRCTRRWRPTLDDALDEIAEIQRARPRRATSPSGRAGR